jgi:endoglucanase
MHVLFSPCKEAGCGNALWNLKCYFGVIDNHHADVKYEDYKGNKIDRKMLELIKEF